jgi:hypothetical protein
MYWAWSFIGSRNIYRSSWISLCRKSIIHAHPRLCETMVPVKHGRQSMRSPDFHCDCHVKAGTGALVEAVVPAAGILPRRARRDRYALGSIIKDAAYGHVHEAGI